MKVGILELLLDTAAQSPIDAVIGRMFRRILYSVMPQTAAVWCRELGHEVHYATYYGQRDPERLLPKDLDVVFIAAYTQASGLANALATLYRRDGVLTVIGGPHAKAFPEEALRFFDIVVGDCDKPLIDDILRGRFDPPAVVSSGKPLSEFPSVEERMPELEVSALRKGWEGSAGLVSLLSSIGCPYQCDFCIDWNNPYVAAPADRLAADLHFVSENLPGALVAFHDPNFAVRFDETMNIMETVPQERRNGYVMESSLSVLKESRLERLRRTNCLFVAPGVESWADYTNKAGGGIVQGRDKLERVVAHFEQMREYVPGLQANFIFGTDVDRGSDPVELTIEFMRRLPYVWPGINIPVPFGGTPLYDRYLAEGRILRDMPVSLYFAPYLVTTLKHYEPLEYYDHLIRISETMTSRRMIFDRIRARNSKAMRAFLMLRTLVIRQELRELRRVRAMLAADPAFRAFHDGRPIDLPEFYHRRYERRLGRYAELIPRRDRYPVAAETPLHRLNARSAAKPAAVPASTPRRNARNTPSATAQAP